MKMHLISASDSAHNTSEILERILAGESISVMRNKTEIAHIVPAKRTMKAAQALDGLAGRLTPTEGDAWLRERRGDSDEAVSDPWA